MSLTISASVLIIALLREIPDLPADAPCHDEHGEGFVLRVLLS